MFFSFLMTASVLSHRRFAVFLTLTGSKFAISTSIFFVVVVMQLSFPPIIPPSARIFVVSAITISSGVRICVLSKRSVNSSPCFACLIMRFQLTLFASKKWIGCPDIHINIFEKSTQLFLGCTWRSSIWTLVKKEEELT